MCNFLYVENIGVHIRRRYESDEKWYGEKMSNSSEMIVVRLKEFFKYKQLDLETGVALKLCLIEHQYEVLTIRGKTGSFLLCFEEAVKFIVRVPGLESLKISYKKDFSQN